MTKKSKSRRASARRHSNGGDGIELNSLPGDSDTERMEEGKSSISVNQSSQSVEPGLEDTSLTPRASTVANISDVLEAPAEAERAQTSAEDTTEGTAEDRLQAATTQNDTLPVSGDSEIVDQLELGPEEIQNGGPASDLLANSAGSDNEEREGRHSDHLHSSCESEEAEPERWTHKTALKFTECPGVDPFAKLHEELNKYDEALCRGWLNDLDSMIIFTGLFSAVATAFVIESLPWLDSRQDSGDRVALLLEAMLKHQLNSSAIVEIPPYDREPHYAFQSFVSIIYFACLTTALCVAFMCIPMKQLLCKYQKHIDMSSPRDTTKTRHGMFDYLQEQSVPQVMAALPIALQIGLFLFLLGILMDMMTRSVGVGMLLVLVIVGFFLLIHRVTILPRIRTLLKIW